MEGFWMMKRSFFNRQSAALTMLYSPVNITDAVARARNAEEDGADAIALELKNIPLESRTVEKFKGVINSVQLPFMFVSYRNDCFLGGDDDARQEYLLNAAVAGAEVIDVMGDLYAPAPRELASEPGAIAKQKKLIAKIHDLGAKVIMSSHMKESLASEDVLAHMLEQSSRGADMMKLVITINTEEEMLEAVRTLLLLRKKLDKPYVFLTSGAYGRFIRYTGAKLGVAVQFALYEHIGEWGIPPTVKSFRKVLDNFHWDIDNVKL